MPLHVVIGPGGGLDFAKTSMFIRSNFDQMLQFKLINQPSVFFDFGPGAERAFQCPDPLCQRHFPAQTATVDHCIAQANLLHAVHYLGGIREMQLSHNRFDIGESGDINVVYHSPTGNLTSNIHPQLYDYDNGNKRISIYSQIGRGAWAQRTYTCQNVPVVNILANIIENLQLMCHFCNARKGNR